MAAMDTGGAPADRSTATSAYARDRVSATVTSSSTRRLPATARRMAGSSGASSPATRMTDDDDDAMFALQTVR